MAHQRASVELGILCGLAVLLLSACAIGEVIGTPPTATAAVIIEIPIAPTQTFVGPCSLASRNQEQWLQNASGQLDSFRAMMQGALEMPELRSELLGQMGQLRTLAYQNPTPECAVPLQLLLTSSIDMGVEAVRASMLDPRFDLPPVAAEVYAQLDLVFEQLKLMAQDLEAQLQAQAGS